MTWVQQGCARKGVGGCLPSPGLLLLMRGLWVAPAGQLASGSSLSLGLLPLFSSNAKQQDQVFMPRVLGKGTVGAPKIVSRLQCPVAWPDPCRQVPVGVRVLRPPGARDPGRIKTGCLLTRAAWAPWVGSPSGPCGQPSPMPSAASFSLCPIPTPAVCTWLCWTPPGLAVVCPFTLQAGSIERLVRG